MEDAVAGADMGQEGISQALAGMSTFHQASDVNNIEECWDFAATQEAKGKKVNQDFKHYEYYFNQNRNCSHCAVIQYNSAVKSSTFLKLEILNCTK